MISFTSRISPFLAVLSRYCCNCSAHSVIRLNIIFILLGVKAGVSLERSILHFVPFNCNRLTPKGLISSSVSAIPRSWKHRHYRHMHNASGLPEFNSSYLHIATFYKTQLLLFLVFQYSILQQYDTSLANHVLAFWCNIVSFFSRVKSSLTLFLVLQSLRNLSIQLPSHAVLHPRRMEHTHASFYIPLL